MLKQPHAVGRIQLARFSWPHSLFSSTACTGFVHGADLSMGQIRLYVLYVFIVYVALWSYMLFLSSSCHVYNFLSLSQSSEHNQSTKQSGLQAVLRCSHSTLRSSLVYPIIIPLHHITCFQQSKNRDKTTLICGRHFAGMLDFKRTMDVRKALDKADKPVNEVADRWELPLIKTKTEQLVLKGKQ